MKNSFSEKGIMNDLPWLLSLLKRLRPDIQARGDSEFQKWLLLAGIREYVALSENGDFKNSMALPFKNSGISQLMARIYQARKDLRKAFPPDGGMKDYMVWFYQHGVDEHGLLPLLDATQRDIYQRFHPVKKMGGSNMAPENGEGKFGVNLVGYAYGELGIGEDLRMTARALQRAGVPFSIINFPPGPGVPEGDMSMRQFVGQDAPYLFNLFCMSPMETARYYAMHGKSLFLGRRNIGYWPWELPFWPGEWRDLIALMDEVWVSSRHIYEALAPICETPVQIMPLAVEVEDVAAMMRDDFGLPPGDYLFCFSFDLKSSIYRKNPMGCLQAFERAFPDPQQLGVGMVIKCHKPAQPCHEWEILKKKAQADPRIHIMERTLSRPELLALYKNCDCFVSLHRAEGYGRGIAEALLLGLDVIATGYSGNVDYCMGNPQARLVRYELQKVESGQYPYHEGQYWAMPDIEHAASIMRQNAAAGRKARPVQPSNLDWTGQRYKNRLNALAGFINKYTDKARNSVGSEAV